MGQRHIPYHPLHTPLGTRCMNTRTRTSTESFDNFPFESIDYRVRTCIVYT
jgi:hypothetical protein